jgi:dTDP-4-dehydrorhamnose reductase
MSDVLIGHTGFVGSNLAEQRKFDLCVNSKNIDDLKGGHFDTVVCAGVSAVKWKANKNPEEDAAGIAALTDVLDTITAKRMVLISTVDVFQIPAGQDEHSPSDTASLHPYGRHRLSLEDRISTQFKHSNIVRLPALFGPRLRKNILFDLKNNNMVNVINPASSFQWYPLARLWADLKTVIDADLPLVHFATEPVSTADILALFFLNMNVGSKPVPEAHYDFHTLHASIFGGTHPYILDRAEVLEALREWMVGDSK